ncbi:3-oxoadipyl-CoA thiolase [uncultured Thalassospira sp.]|uniref:3-oxoadipyl-CoA thiolase n=1 Tax=uncultured Thalassospira sp. TaxID=404382 RepID=UPI0025936A12|nr:3-oxoadipyl-CoA thiolase [uncultured Thalassospira sp.]
MADAYICDYIRTPIGRFGGSLSQVRADDLGAVPLKALVERNPDLDFGAVDDVVFGCANQAGEDNRNVARMALLLAGLPETVPGVTVNRLCGSGMDAVGTAARAIKSGEAQLVLAGGVESMSRAPFVMPKAAVPFSRNTEIYDTTIGWRFENRLFKQRFGTDSMPETAETVAREYGVTREDQDLFAYHSQKKASAAIEAGRFQEEICPVELQRKGAVIGVFEQDEHPRKSVNLEALAELPTPFADQGTVTAGNASGVNDGAAALLVASEAAVSQWGLTPVARIIAMQTVGVAPRVMGIGPLPASQRLLASTGLSIDQLSVIELNEAFASQSLAVTRGLGLADDDPRVNPNGGAIALGHPLGMSGSRLMLTASKELSRVKGSYALCTMCIGVGQGIAMLIERV